MYLVSPDYLYKNERPSPSPAKTPHKTLTRVKRKRNKKKNDPQHPFDKWIAVRGKIAEAAVERKALIKAITDFIKTVLPDITLTQKVATPKRESVEYGTQTAPPPLTRVVPLPSTSSKYMKQRLVLLVHDL
jgi:hypothetical protein